MSHCSSMMLCFTYTLSCAAGEITSSSVWNSAILLCTRSLRRFRPTSVFSIFDSGSRSLFDGKKRTHTLTTHPNNRVRYPVSSHILSNTHIRTRRCRVSSSRPGASVRTRTGMEVNHRLCNCHTHIHIPCVRIIRLELCKAPLEAVVVFQFHHEQSPELERITRDRELIGRRRARLEERRQRRKLRQFDLMYTRHKGQSIQKEDVHVHKRR